LSAASCEDALAALDRRSPDLVLLPVLLPQAEEGELLSRLRDQTGTDIPALTIPQLRLPDAVAPEPVSTHPAWLKQILHPHDTIEQPGEECEPAVFADLIRSYLGPVHDVVTDAASAVADAARAAAEKRRAHLVAAARATVTWIRNRRERWNDRPPVIAISAPPLDVAMPLPPPAPVPAAPVRCPRPCKCGAVSCRSRAGICDSAEHSRKSGKFSAGGCDLVRAAHAGRDIRVVQKRRRPGVVARAVAFIGKLKRSGSPKRSIPSARRSCDGFPRRPSLPWC
jgi:hypothetical protein